MSVQTDPYPLVAELTPAPDAEQAFLRLCDRPHCLFLDSARRDPLLGRYSFVACDPFEYFALSPDDAGAFSEVARRVRGLKSATVPGLPPFQGGAAGLFSYDLCRGLERLPQPARNEFQLPGMAIGLYDALLAFDHQQGRAWIISQGYPETDAQLRRRRAEQRLEGIRRRLAAPAAQPAAESGGAHLAVSELAPQFPVSRLPGLTSNFSPAAYLTAVRRAIDYIYAGDIFQVNLSQRLLFPARDHAVDLYLRLRRRNPATFAGYFNLGDFQIVSASPERFLQVRDRRVEARPIKGTRPRRDRPEADMFSGEELQQSEKDRAENVMIVDLLRNDLSRVCRAETVRVTQLCRLESYEFVQHLVSAVCGELREGHDAADALAAAFPGGSITGAPKVRAMEIIAELEPTARGAYCGALGYLGFDGSMDTSILIRTITAGRGWWQAPVGGGIVAQSVPIQEYEETWHKAEGLIRSMAP